MTKEPSEHEKALAIGEMIEQATGESPAEVAFAFCDLLDQHAHREWLIEFIDFNRSKFDS